MKRVSISIPCYNESQNVKLITEAILKIFDSDTRLRNYNCMIEFIDNDSTDQTKEILKEVYKAHPDNVKVIFNVKNFGSVSSYYGLLQSKGDCTIVMPCDFQVPVSIIPELIEKWESGSKIVCAIKKESKENMKMKSIRNIYYSLIDFFSHSHSIAHFTGAGLYDKEFVCVLRGFDDSIPSLRGLVAEYGYKIEKIFYKEESRKSGRSKQSLMSLFQVAFKNLFLYSEFLSMITLILSLILIGLSILFFVFGILIGVIAKINVEIYVLIGVVLAVGGTNMFGISALAKYLTYLNIRVMGRPLVIEEYRLGDENNDDNKLF